MLTRGMIMSNTNNNCPKLRFKGFNEPWEQKQLSELCNRIIVGLATSVTPFYRSSGVPLLRNMNIKKNYLDDSDILFLDEEYASNNTSKMIHGGDVLSVHTGSNIGLSCVAPEKYDNSLSFTTLITTPNKELLNNRFLSQYINSDKGMNRIYSIITAGGKPNLNSGDLEKLIVAHSPEVKEQELIGILLEKLDDVIKHHRHKLEKYRMLKQSFLCSMFAGDKKGKPDIRFSGFSESWEQASLINLIEPLYVGLSFSGSLEVENANYIVMDMGSVDSSGNRVESKKTNLKRDVLLKGDLIMPKDDIGGGQIIGRTAYIPSDNMYVLGDHVFRIRPKSIRSLFCHYFINSPYYNKKIKLCVTGSAQLGLRGTYVENSIIKYPLSLEEQDKIGDLFRTLDDLVILYKNKCEKLIKIKQALLSDMLV